MVEGEGVRGARARRCRGGVRLWAQGRAAVGRHYLHGYPREEVGKVHGVPCGSVSSRSAKAMVVMREALVENEQIVIPARSGE